LLQERVILKNNRVLSATMIKNVIILILLAFGGVFYHLNSVNQRALECSAYVHEGVDLTGRGENNCTNPELIP
jgi:hypothetical protein